jgi:hypothetical protein
LLIASRAAGPVRGVVLPAFPAVNPL